MRYLDHAATTPMRPAVREAMAPYLATVFGNPSGIHEISRRAKNAVEDARERAAALVGAAKPHEIVFTGGGTEADNLAVVGAALARPGRGVVISAVEHAAVVESARFVGRLGREVRIVEVDAVGRVDPAAVARAAAELGDPIVSVMAANNEIGTIEPVAAVVAAVRSAAPDAIVHTDAVQAAVSEDVSVGALGADLISLAAHKLGGPKGVGLLYVRDGVELEPVLHGGGQELGRRSGTHDVAGIVGMVAAMEEAMGDRDGFRRRVGAARDVFERSVADRLGDVVATVPSEVRLVQHAHLRFVGIDAETLLVKLDMAGVAAAAGSACQSGAIETSHVLAAIGMDRTAAGECVRFTFGWPDDEAAGRSAADAVVAVAETLR